MFFERPKRFKSPGDEDCMADYFKHHNSFPLHYPDVLRSGGVVILSSKSLMEFHVRMNDLATNLVACENVQDCSPIHRHVWTLCTNETQLCERFPPPNRADGLLWISARLMIFTRNSVVNLWSTALMVIGHRTQNVCFTQNALSSRCNFFTVDNIGAQNFSIEPLYFHHAKSLTRSHQPSTAVQFCIITWMACRWSAVQC